MKILISIYLIVTVSLSLVAQTKESSQEYYFSAKENFKGKKYNEAISNLALSEKSGGGSNAYIQILRVKCYLATNDFTSARSALDRCNNYKVSSKLNKEITSLSVKIEKKSKVKKAKLSVANQNKFRNLTIKKEKQDKEVEERRIYNEDERLWKEAESNNTVTSYMKYKNDPLGINHKREAVDKIDKLIWHKAFTLNTYQGYMAYLNSRVLSKEKKKHYYRARKYVTVKEINSLVRYNLPRDITRYVRLEFLNIQQTSLRSLPKNIGDLSSVEKIFLIRNKLTYLPKSFGNLTKLKTLYLAYNQLSSLPETFGNLSSLEACYLGRNNLSSLPESIGDLKQLKTLSLEVNDLKSLPQSFVNLSSLERLVIDRSTYKIKQVKAVIKELKKRNRFLKVIVNKYENETGYGYYR